jgi:NAD+ kinase
MKPKKIGIISHPRVDPGFMKKVVARLGGAGVELFFDPVAAKKAAAKPTKVRDMAVDIAVVVGGDGTLLWVAGEIAGEPPLLGVNTGTVGHLAELSPDGFFDHAASLLRGKFSVDSRTKISVGGRFEALNEVLVVSKDPATLLEFRVRLDGVEVARFRADGVMVSTPTGSTGYSMSAGGPILHPDVSAFVITPTNPVLRCQFPIVVPEDSKIELELLREDREAKLIVDGRHAGELSPKDSVRLTKARRCAKFVRFSKNSNYKHVNVGRLR